MLFCLFVCRQQSGVRAAGHQHRLHLRALHLCCHYAGPQRNSAAVQWRSAAHSVHKQVCCLVKTFIYSFFFFFSTAVFLILQWWNLLYWFWLQSSGKTGPEQHIEESRAPFVQLLQALRLGLYKWPLESTKAQRGGLFLPTPKFPCFKVIADFFFFFNCLTQDRLWLEYVCLYSDGTLLILNVLYSP